MAGLGVEVLGPVRALVDAEPVALPGGRTPGLLAALALTRGQPVRADALAEILWDGAPPPKWEASLYSRFSRLRRALGGAAPAIHTTTAGYALDIDDDAFDLQRFERLAVEGRALLARGDAASGAGVLAQALDAWRGPAFGHLADLDHFRNIAQTLEEQRFAAFEALVDARLALGEHEAAVADLERHVQAAPYRERGWALLVVALYRSGRQADALRRGAEVRELLAAELGIEPGPELRTLERAVLDHDPALAAPILVVASPVPNVEPERVDMPSWLREPENAFVGRASEIARLAAAWEGIGRGETRVVLLEGEPGLGKTRLIAHARLELGIDDVLAGRCDEDPLLPYQPIAEALGPFSMTSPFLEALGPSAGALALVLPDLVVRFPELRALDAGDLATARAAAVAAIGAFRRWIAPGRPILLVIDDLQWAPPPTMRLLRQLLRARALDPVLVVATARVDERSSEVDAALETWERERLLERVRLQALDADDVTSLAESRQATATIAARAREIADGNPYFVEELVRHLLESGEALPGTRVPDTVRATVDRRLHRLRDETRAILDVAALIGAEFDVELLARVVGDTESVDRALDEANRAGLVRDVTSRIGSYAFGHATVREVLLDGIGPARRTRMHGHAALVLTDLVAQQPNRRRALAHHASEAASDLLSARRAIDATLGAAALAIERRSYDDAEGLISRTLHRCAEVLPRVDPSMLALRIAHADAIGRCGATDDAAAELRAIAREAFGVGEARLAARALNIAMSWISTPQPEQLELYRSICEAMEGSDSDEALIARLNAVDITDLAEVEGAVPLVHSTLDAIRAAPRNAATQATLMFVGADILTIVERPETTLPLHRDQLEAAKRDGDPKLVVLAATELRAALLAAGEYDEAEAVAVEYERRAIDARIPRYLAGLEQRRAMRALLEGRFAEAEAHANAAVELQPTPEMFEGYAVQIFGLRKEQARLAEIADAVREYGESSLYPAWRASYAMLLAEVGAPEAARTALEPVLDLSFDAIVPDRYGATFFAVLSEVADLLDDAKLAAAVIPQLRRLTNPVLMVPASTVCWGAIDRFLAPALALVGDLEGARASYLRSLALHERYGARPFLARDQLGLARVLHAIGAHDEAAQRYTGGLRLARELGQRGVVARAEAEAATRP